MRVTRFAIRRFATLTVRLVRTVRTAVAIFLLPARMSMRTFAVFLVPLTRTRIERPAFVYTRRAKLSVERLAVSGVFAVGLGALGATPVTEATCCGVGASVLVVGAGAGAVPVPGVSGVPANVTKRSRPSSTKSAITLSVPLPRISTEPLPSLSRSTQTRFATPPRGSMTGAVLYGNIASAFDAKQTVSPVNGAPVMSNALAVQIQATELAVPGPFGTHVTCLLKAETTVFETVPAARSAAVTGWYG